MFGCDFSPRRDICYEKSNIFMIAYSKILTQSDTSATTVSNELTTNQASNLRRALYLVSLTGCYVESTSAPLQHAWAINHSPHLHRQPQTGTGLSRGSISSFGLTAQILIQKGDWGNGGEWSWPVHTGILVFSVLLTSHGRAWVLSSNYRPVPIFKTQGWKQCCSNE